MKYTDLLLAVSQVQPGPGNGLDQALQERGDGWKSCFEISVGLWLQEAEGR